MVSSLTDRRLCDMQRSLRKQAGSYVIQVVAGVYIHVGICIYIYTDIYIYTYIYIDR